MISYYFHFTVVAKELCNVDYYQLNTTEPAYLFFFYHL